MSSAVFADVDGTSTLGPALRFKGWARWVFVMGLGTKGICYRDGHGGYL